MPMPGVAVYGLPQNGSFVAEPQQYADYIKGGAVYAAAPPHTSYQPRSEYGSYQPGAEYGMYGSAESYVQTYSTAPYQQQSVESMYGSAAPYGQSYTSAPATYLTQPSHQQYSMPSTASFTNEQPIQQTYQMPTTASFTAEPYEHPVHYYQQQQYGAAPSSYALPQQQSFTAYPQQSNYPSMGGGQFQFYAKDTPQHQQLMYGLGHQSPPDVPSRPTGSMNHGPSEHGQAQPIGPTNHGPAQPAHAKPPARTKPDAPIGGVPPAKRTGKKKGGCCGRCGV
jgi:hypothetical protein